MIDRRRFISLLAGAALPRGPSRPPAVKVVLYAAVGGEISLYDVDVARAALTQRGSVTLPSSVQYAWPHRSRKHLYVASSDGEQSGSHHLSALRIDPASGELRPHGDPTRLRARPIHLTADDTSEYLLIAYNHPSGVTVHRVNPDATIGREVSQPGTLDTGVYAHQVRVPPSGGRAILVTRGNDADGGRPEDPGALKVFRLRDGVLANRESIAPHGGYGFGPRHIDFHPSERWVYVSLERQNQICLFKLKRDTVGPEPLFIKSTLANPRDVRPRQRAGAIHVHPGGRFLYVANRADGTTHVGGRAVFAGGENNIAVYRLDARTGEPTLIQHADTRGVHARTFHLDPSGRILVAANLTPLHVRDGATLRAVPAGLSVFRVGGDGRLVYVRKYDVAVGQASLFWVGMSELPGATPAKRQPA